MPRDSSRSRGRDNETDPTEQLRTLLEMLAQALGEPCRVRISPQSGRSWKTDLYLSVAIKDLLLRLLDLLEEDEIEFADDDEDEPNEDGEGGEDDATAQEIKDRLRGRRDARGHTPMQSLIVHTMKATTKRMKAAAIAAKMGRRDGGGFRAALQGLVEMGDVDDEDGMYLLTEEGRRP